MQRLRLTVNGIDAAVDNHGAFLDPIASNHLGLSDRDDENIGSSANVFEVLGLRVTNGDCRVVPLQ